MPRSKGLITNYREIPYNPDLKNRAREMRNNPTPGESIMWNYLLKNRQIGCQFYRQKILNHYIVDFYCAALKLVIEIDGDSHLDKAEYDENRIKTLESLGLKVIVIKDDDVKMNFSKIKAELADIIKKRKNNLTTDPSP